MRRSLSLFARIRGVILLLALLSQAGLGNAQRLQCHMHGLGAMQTAADAAGGKSAQHHPASHHSGANTESTDCCCGIDDCSTAVVMPAAPDGPTLRVAVEAAQPHRALDIAPALPTHPEPDRRLPFANGPPAGVLL